LARVVLGKEPMSGAFFVFRSRGRQMLRILCYDLCEAPRYVE